jgi:hypothetical protein
MKASFQGLPLLSLAEIIVASEAARYFCRPHLHRMIKSNIAIDVMDNIMRAVQAQSMVSS